VPILAIVDLGVESCQVLDVFLFARIADTWVNAEIDIDAAVAEPIGNLGCFDLGLTVELLRGLAFRKGPYFNMAGVGIEARLKESVEKCGCIVTKLLLVLNDR
jgi:hypothetical protein